MSRYFRASGAAGAAILIWLVQQTAGAAERVDGHQILRELSRAVAQVAAEVQPGVVSVYTTKTVRVPPLQLPEIPGFPFPFEQTPQRSQPQQKYRQTALGSGFVIDAKKGYVLTNNHVVDKAEDVKVHVRDGHEVAAKVIGADPKTDLAVIQIPADNLVALKLGDSDKVEPGDFVLAIGSPFGLSETVTSGIISAKGRSNLAIEDYEDFLQTDAAINMGNSGGPLVNADGEVIGVNTAILSRTGGSVGVGFAIPINLAKSIADQLIQTGKVTRGWLGVQIQNLTEEMAGRFGWAGTDGALVTQVIENTPAAKAGMKVGDIILEYDGHKIADVSKLRSFVAATAPGATAKIVVWRDKKKETLTATIEKMTEAALAAAGGGSAEALGITVQDLTPDIASRLGVGAKAGAVVTAVQEGSPAADKGMKQGDVIVEVDRTPVKNSGEFEAALKKADIKKGVLLLVVDSKGSRFVVAKAEPEKDE